MTEGRRTLALALLPLAFLADVHPALAACAARRAGQFSVGLLADSYLQWRIVWSLLQAAASCVAALLVGLPLAWCLARYRFPGRSLTLRLLMLPFVMPTLVAGMGVLALFGPQGLLGINLQDTPWLLLYGNLFFNLPLVIRAACEGLSQIPASRIAAARTLGATPWRVFWRVEWPAVRPWLWSALCLVFLYCFSGFGLALLLGGQRYATVEVEIYQLVAYELNLADAGALAMLMLLVTGAMATLYAWLERRLAAPLKVDPLPPRPPQGAQWLQLLAALAVLLLFGGLPLLAVLWKAAQALWLLGPGLLRMKMCGWPCSIRPASARWPCCWRRGWAVCMRWLRAPAWLCAPWPFCLSSCRRYAWRLACCCFIRNGRPAWPCCWPPMPCWPIPLWRVAWPVRWTACRRIGRRRRAVWAHRRCAPLPACCGPCCNRLSAVVWPLPLPPRWASLPSRCFCRGRSG
jgi:ABC-type sulfate transport system permease component